MKNSYLFAVLCAVLFFVKGQDSPTNCVFQKNAFDGSQGAPGTQVVCASNGQDSSATSSERKESIEDNDGLSWSEADSLFNSPSNSLQTLASLDKLDRNSRSPGHEFLRFGRDGPLSSGMRFGRSENFGHKFMRFGRAADTGHKFMRFGRGGDISGHQFLRFGRRDDQNPYVALFDDDDTSADRWRYSDESVEEDPFQRDVKDIGHKFLRFGRALPEHNFMRFGRTNGHAIMKLGGTAGHNFMRFGRIPQHTFMRFGRSSFTEKQHPVENHQEASASVLGNLSEEEATVSRNHDLSNKAEDKVKRDGQSFLRIGRK